MFFGCVESPTLSCLRRQIAYALEKAKTKLTVSKELADIAAKRCDAAKMNARDNGYCPW